MKETPNKQVKTKRLFLKKRSCAKTLFYIVNKEFGHHFELEERAVELLSKGILLPGHQCGLVWGAALAVGVEAFSSGENDNQRIDKALNTTSQLVNSFERTTNGDNYKFIYNKNFNQQSTISSYIFNGRLLRCLKLADRWVPKALNVANLNLRLTIDNDEDNYTCCAMRVVEKMGGSHQESIMVAGFSGGLGLSGNTCGALAATVWYKGLQWLKEHPEEKHYPIAYSQKTVKDFLKISQGEHLCPYLSGKHFNTLDDHSKFIHEGGCNKLIELLAQL